MDGDKVMGWMAYLAKTANIDYFRFDDSLVPDEVLVKDVH